MYLLRSQPLFLISCIVLVGSGLTADSASARPNVLLIVTDDMNTRLGCYGDKLVKTPNLDRFAARGVRFDRAYCQFPLCNPSRVSFLTGLRPDTTGIYDLATNFRSTRPKAVTLPQLFKNNGHFSARVGKIYHYGVPRQIGSGGMDDSDSWDLAINPRGRDKDQEHDIHVLTRGTGTTLGFSMSWLDMDGTDEEQTDGQATTETIQLLERFANEKRPFFIGVGFFRPHTPFVATKKWFQLYPKNAIAPVGDPADDLKDIPEAARTIRPPNYGLSESDLQDCMRAYYASISFVDGQVGQLLDALDRLDLTKNTLVVFVSDHGYMLGEHGQWQKQLLFEESNRVPLIFAGPGVSGRGTVQGPVELLDIYPTLVELCGLPQPRQKLEGRSLVPLLNDPNMKWSRPAYSQVQRGTDQTPAGPRFMGRSIRTNRWRFTEWDNGRRGLELYDHASDPQELKNLANDPAHSKVVAELKALLTKRNANGTN
jgi:uncharacterized sulfatase